MKHKRFIKRWKGIKVAGFRKYLLTRAIIWTVIMYPLIKGLEYFRDNELTFDLSNFWYQLPMFFLSGISLALIMWIVNNYLYAKYTGEFTSENHHHHHD